ncbi:MAG: HAD-IA family hydrolase [Chloroflexi bacterium]|nr:HAD-IA family hydrolase [Chloroflexota bacterium]MDA1174807.1 HAD-IA family hydrolase [Chloroflexota bacterium]
MIRAVFFDFYGTLAGWEPAAGDIQRKSAAAEGLDVDADAIERAYPTANALLDRENAVQRLASRTPEQREAFLAEYEQTLLATAGYDVSLETARAIWLRVRSAPKELALYPDARSTLEELRTAGFILGVISNMGTDLPDYLDHMGIAGLIKASVSSGEVGVAKPHPAVFEAALRKVDVVAREALHVGDGYESDVLGAAAAGLGALYLQRDADVSEPGAHAVVRSLSEVPAHVRELNSSASPPL